MGAGTTDIAIFHEGKIRHLATVSYGGSNVTSDIVQGIGVTQSANIPRKFYTRRLHAKAYTKIRRLRFSSVFDCPEHAGYSAPHVFNDVGRRTNALFAKREPDFENLIAQDGISTLKFRLVEKKLLALPTTPALPNVFHYIVDLGEPEPGAA